jgi:hypothetical protein
MGAGIQGNREIKKVRNGVREIKGRERESKKRERKARAGYRKHRITESIRVGV